MKTSKHLCQPFSREQGREINGLKIHLYRRPIELSDKPDGGPSDFLVWGYYDWVSLIWGEFSLKNFFNDPLRNPDPISAHYEEQFLCAYTDESPKNITSNEMPLLVITEIKLNDQNNSPVLNRAKATLPEIKDEIAHRFDEEFNFQNNVIYQTLYPLGYSDLLIVFRAHSYQPIFEALTKLKTLKVNKEYPVKSTYSIYGIHKQHLLSWSDKNCQRVSIFASLKPGITPVQFQNKVKQTFKSSQMDIQAYHLFGKYDVEIVLENKQGTDNITNVIAEHYCDDNSKPGFLSPNHQYHQGNINYTRTQWLYPLQEQEGEYQNSSCIDLQFDHQNYISELSTSITHHHNLGGNGKSNNNFRILWSAYEFIQEHSSQLNYRISPSLVLGLQDILKFYWQIDNNEIVSRPLRDDIRRILTMLLKIIICDMGVNADQVNNAFESGSFQGLSINEPVDETSFEMAIDLLAELMQSWAQATRMVLETPIYNIRYINSSTKVYICYNIIVELIENALKNNFIDKSIHPELNFFTMIHHSDQVRSHLLFPQAKAKQNLIAIRLDRNSFFSPAESIPLITHEIGHFVSANIPLRYQKFLNTVLYDIARQIFYYVVIGSNNNKYLFNKITKEWSYEAFRIIERIQEHLISYLEMLVDANLSDHDAKDPNFERYCSRLPYILQFAFGFIDQSVEDASQELDRCIDGYIKGNKFPTEAKADKFKEKMDGLVIWLNRLIEQGKDETCASEFFDVEIRQLDNIQSLRNAWGNLIQVYHRRKNLIHALAKEICEIIFKDITNLPDILVKNAQSNLEEKYTAYYFANRQIHENTYWNKKAVSEEILSALRRINYQSTVDLYNELFGETAADLFMIHSLGLSQEAYLKIINSGKRANISRVNRFTRDYIMSIRKFIITFYWSELVEEVDEPKGVNNPLFDEKLSAPRGVYHTDLIEYLEDMANHLRKFCSQSEINKVKTAYQRLHEDVTNKGVMTGECEFLEKFWGNAPSNFKG